MPGGQPEGQETNDQLLQNTHTHTKQNKTHDVIVTVLFGGVTLGLIQVQYGIEYIWDMFFFLYLNNKVLAE